MTLISEEDREELETAISKTLDETEKKVIQLRFGLDGNDEHTQQATAQKIGLPLNEVWDTERNALNKLRQRMCA